MDDQQCILHPSQGLRLLADGLTVMHVSPGSVRPLTAHLGSSLRAIGGYFEVRVLASKKNAIKIGLLDPGLVAARTIPMTADICLCLSADTGMLVIKTKDGSRRAAATTFGPGDTIGIGHESEDRVERQSSTKEDANGASMDSVRGRPSTRNFVFVTRNGRKVESFPIPNTSQSLLDFHPVVVLCSTGDFVCLDAQKALDRATMASSPSLSPSTGRAKNVSSMLVFENKHFHKNRLSSHLTVQKITKTGIGAVHVKKDLWSMARRLSTAEQGVKTYYFEVTFSLPVPSEEESRPYRGVRGRLSRAESRASLSSVSSFDSTE